MPDFRDNLSLDASTLLEVSPLLGYALEDRSSVREKQCDSLAQTCIDFSKTPLREPQQAEQFYFGCFDVLVSYTADGKLQFHPTEFNGTGTGGISNLPEMVLRQIIDTMGSMAQCFTDEHYTEASQKPSVILLPFAGTSKTQVNGQKPQYKLLIEKIWQAQAIKKTFEAQQKHCTIITLEQALNPQWRAKTPFNIVLGYTKDTIDAVVEKNKQLYLGDHPQALQVIGATHDRLCAFLSEKAKVAFSSAYLRQKTIFANRFFTLCDKGLFLNTAQKAIARYGLNANLIQPGRYTHAYHQDELVNIIYQALQEGRQVVAKPRYSAMARGIEFFLEPMSLDAVSQQIKNSIHYVSVHQTPDFAIWPYSVVDFFDCAAISKPEHPLFNHKYELRIMVYRQEQQLLACPGIVKISGLPVNHENHRLALINNVAAVTSDQKHQHVLPLCNTDTLDLLGLEVEHLKTLCHFATQVIAQALEIPSSLKTASLVTPVDASATIASCTPRL